ncbi:peptide chain release factor N(5)-glutamine methyltransferase [Thalassotalea sediminis]|uniref:peptide chain release factor N(5)-glutamine methyltransferase n=1 Tax=Thalassotalea sediminis TaxID=1759089 RepID=UPI0025734DE4|nr:peptide chain release factor N(5)-glutamine methyltransferase [Thalassotalea sediminis]
MGESVPYTIEQAIAYGSKLIAAISDSAKLDCQVLLSFCLGKPTSYLFTWPEKSLTLEQQAQFVTLIEKRVEGEPIAYLVGEKEFWSLPFKVSPATLIPRPDTEVLVEQVIENHNVQSCQCLDLGTGTGAIAIALATENPGWQVEAIDFQEAAVELAKENATNLNVANVRIYQSHWFSHVENTKCFDVIVSNPPYIDQADEHLSLGDVVYEPKSALVAENCGLSDIQTIAKDARRYLKEGGYLYLEHGYKQKDAVVSILLALGYSNVQTIKDYNNNDRVTFACYREQ